MRLVSTYRDLDPAAKGAVVAIGNFDGVHRGHQAVLARARAAAAAAAPFGVVTFEPHPRRFFRPDLAPFRLTEAPAKRRLVAGLGAALYYELAFDAALAGLSAERFVAEVLAGGIGARHVVVGDGFVFGKGRAGTLRVLQSEAARHGIGVSAVSPVADAGGVAYSSSRIRQLLAEGRVDDAGALLGRAFAIEGVVTPGDKRGRAIGFPTANIALGEHVRPAFGVYAVRVRFPEDGGRPPLTGVANLGLRPTIGDGRELLETHLFDFAGDLYGQRLAVELVAHLRPERKFAGLDALKAQIALDGQKAREILASA
jgi:riboflavin kinase / FMN adenylyltransferase